MFLHISPMIGKLCVSLLLVATVGAKESRCLLPGSFECLDSTCIPGRYTCDGYFDCADAEDELNCSECPEGHFHCQSADICIPEHWLCDGRYHCPNGEDEQNCFITQPPGCADGYYECDNGLCILEIFHCDSINDCHDGEDERDCTECNPGFHCQENRCLPEYYLCDDYEDCVRGEDEAICDCEETDFVCFNGHCIPPDWHCDGDIDCFGGDDEMNCDVRDTPGARNKLHSVSRAQTHFLKKVATGRLR